MENHNLPVSVVVIQLLKAIVAVFDNPIARVIMTQQQKEAIDNASKYVASLK